MNYITYFSDVPMDDDVPEVFPSPFSDEPIPLAEKAVLMLQHHLHTQSDWQHDFDADDGGKMFGVLLVRDAQGKIGFLSAFSGMLAGCWQLPGFVPPVFDEKEHDRFLPAGRAELMEMAEKLVLLQESSERTELLRQIPLLRQERERELAAIRARHKEKKAQRKLQRQSLAGLGDADEIQRQMSALALASQHDKREGRNAIDQWNEREQALQQQLDVIERQIAEIKTSRTEKSRGLHKKVFASYMLSNSLGDRRNITEFYLDASPPGGAGDCAGPKLIQYAHQHSLRPLALAEFWWGASPSAGVRHHGQFYPACRGKCRPILPYMLTGLEVEPEPMFGLNIDQQEPQVVYEDDVLLVVNKPAGLMSVPGKEIEDSVFSRLLQRYPDCPELRLVHRLDMSTSGILLVAKNLRANKFLQKQFIQRSVEKRYEAILSKALPVEQDQGEIDLPLRVDLYDRPRQLVCYEHGKAAKTHWQVISREGDCTRVYFYPLTGRTHQLRIHASHKNGLDAAIVGDELYGVAGERLLLHAQRLCFTHPVSRERIDIEVAAPF
jgi:tRNA pseudouridine32 synthase/23S rRNA pseudouridine746 synthase